jgi:hypothetical protein
VLELQSEVRAILFRRVVPTKTRLGGSLEDGQAVFQIVFCVLTTFCCSTCDAPQTFGPVAQVIARVSAALRVIPPCYDCAYLCDTFSVSSELCSIKYKRSARFVKRETG